MHTTYKPGAHLSHLPVIVGLGGINSAGRSSFHHAYRRLVIDKLNNDDANETLSNLAVLMGLLHHDGNHWVDANNQIVELGRFLEQNRKLILAGTLIRKMENSLFDVENLYSHQSAIITPCEADNNLSFTLATRKLPKQIPDNWTVTPTNDEKISKVVINGDLELMFKDSFKGSVHAAGQLPDGFAPDSLYPSRHHPRGLQMTVYGASDAIYSMGIDWSTIRATVAPDQIAVFAGSSMSQLDYNGNGGLLQARLLGKKVTSKQLPLGFAEMPADFINAYLLGSIGTTGTNLGACATFHYNLAQAVRGIQSGTHRVAIVGCSEAPLTPEVFEGFTSMGALADDKKLLALDEKLGLTAPNYRRASRPFANNAGFTMSESAQFIILFDDALALELGASIYGSVNDVFINADGPKKSIAGPGIGNYITVAKAAAATRAVIGVKGLRERTFVQAHGTSTPQNRVTESAIFSTIAEEFGISHWPIAAVKSYLGHSLACSGADQLVSTLGVWKYGIIPGILTSDEIADDVTQKNLDFLLQHKEVATDEIEAALLNSKGFGGNNSTAAILSPDVTRRMLEKKHGTAALTKYTVKHEKVAEAAATYEQRCNREQVAPIYNYAIDVKSPEDVHFKDGSISIEGYKPEINLNLKNKYSDMCD